MKFAAGKHKARDIKAKERGRIFDGPTASVGSRITFGKSADSYLKDYADLHKRSAPTMSSAQSGLRIRGSCDRS